VYGKPRVYLSPGRFKSKGVSGAVRLAGREVVRARYSKLVFEVMNA
jgi:hypothetical protein